MLILAISLPTPSISVDIADNYRDTINACRTYVQVIPQITSVPYYTTLVPLLFVLTLSAIKDMVDDIVSTRHTHARHTGATPSCAYARCSRRTLERVCATAARDNFSLAQAVLLTFSCLLHTPYTPTPRHSLPR